MNASEFKKLLNGSLDPDNNADAEKIQEKLNYDFSSGFSGRVLEKIYSVQTKVASEVEFSRYLSFAFSRVALTGVAAIVLLLISIFLMQGSLSFNSILGLTDNQTESIVCLLTGN